MVAKVQSLFKKPGYRYMVVGVSVYLLEMLVILGAQKLGANSVFAVGIGFCVGLVVSFTLQKFVAFGDKQMKRKILLPQIVAFALLVLFNFGFTLGFVWLVNGFMAAVIARTIALGVTTIWNFYLYKTRIFKAEPLEFKNTITY